MVFGRGLCLVRASAGNLQGPLWHGKLGGNFWGPIVMTLKKSWRWMTIEKALDPGSMHGYIPKDGDLTPYWKRGNVICTR
jgi:hypothetical protein